MTLTDRAHPPGSKLPPEEQQALEEEERLVRLWSNLADTTAGEKEKRRAQHMHARSMIILRVCLCVTFVCTNMPVGRSVQGKSAAGGTELAALAAMVETIDSWHGERRRDMTAAKDPQPLADLQRDLHGVDLSTIKKIVDMRGAGSASFLLFLGRRPCACLSRYALA
jgi:hypothetical protein